MPGSGAVGGPTIKTGSFQVDCKEGLATTITSPKGVLPSTVLIGSVMAGQEATLGSQKRGAVVSVTRVLARAVVDALEATSASGDLGRSPTTAPSCSSIDCALCNAS